MTSKDRFYELLKRIGICFLLVLLGVGITEGQEKSLCLDTAIKRYVTYDEMSLVQLDLPQIIENSRINIEDVSVSEEELSRLIKTNYVCRNEKYGMMLLGPDLMVLTVQDESLSNKNITNIKNRNDLEHFLNQEVQLGIELEIKGKVQKNTDEGKIIAPITLSDFSFATEDITGSYTGFVSVIQKEDKVSGVCVVAAPVGLPSSATIEQRNMCEVVAKSFRVNSNYSHEYAVYGNNMHGFSYENGGLFSYLGYSYDNLGSRELDTKGTYNQLDDLVGMYCVKTNQYGLINLPYILSDKKLRSSISEDSGFLKANIHSGTSHLKYDVRMNSFSENEDFKDVLDEIKKMIELDYVYFSKELGYQKKRIVSEQIDKNSMAIITVCGWNETTGERAVVYYKLTASKDLYTITRIEDNKKITDEIDPLLKRLMDLSGIILV